MIMRTSVRLALLFGLSCTAFSCVNCQEFRVTDYPTDGVRVGNGWSSRLAKKTTGDCIEFREKQDPAQQRYANIHRVVDKEQLNKTMDVSAEFQARQILGHSASLKAEYSNALEVSSESVHLSLIARVKQGATSAYVKPGKSAIVLKSDMVQLAKYNPAKFLAVCGDSYVSAIHSGGELDAFFTFTTSSREERETVSAMMTGSMMSFSGSLTANKTMKDYYSNSKLNILIHTAGGSGEPISVSEQELLQELKNLPAAVAKAAENYSISLSRYDDLLNWPGGKTEADKFRQMEQLVTQYQHYLGVYSDIAKIIKAPSNYIIVGKISIENVKNVQDKVGKALSTLKGMMAKCSQQSYCELPVDARLLDYDLRVGLPVKRGSFAEDLNMIALDKAYAQTVAADAAVPSQVWMNMGGSCNGGFCTNSTLVANPAKPASTQTVIDAKSAVDAARKTYNDELAQAMRDQWISIPSEYRCATDPTSIYCLTNVQQDVYAARIKALVQ